MATTRSSRYELLVQIATGGMATVYVARLSGASGFERLVAVKRAHPHLVQDPTFRRMLKAEAQIASRLHHPNIVAIRDVEEIDGELVLVMDYVDGAPLSQILAASFRDELPLAPAIAVRIVLDSCEGLHAAHQLAGDDGVSLGLVHRDVSPQNILIGVDGIARIADFGVAKVERAGAMSVEGLTSTGALKGKIAYMAPEYIEGEGIDRRADVFALGVVAWEALAKRRLFRGANDMESLRLVVAARVPPLREIDASLHAFDAVVAKALARKPAERWADAHAFGEALEAAARAVDAVASHAEVGAHVRASAGDALEERRSRIAEVAKQPGPAIRSYDGPTTVGVATSPEAETRDAMAGRRSGVGIRAAVGVLALGGVVGAVLFVSNRTPPAIGIVSNASSSPELPSRSADAPPPVSLAPVARALPVVDASPPTAPGTSRASVRRVPAARPPTAPSAAPLSGPEKAEPNPYGP